MIKLIFYALLLVLNLGCDAGCSDCDATQCLTCQHGYFLLDNVCSICQNNCFECQSQTKCLTCNQNFYAQNGICNHCLTGCQICTDGVTCTKCFTTYYLSQSFLCSSCGSLCVSCTQANLCVNCISGFYSKNGVCNSCGSNCIKCLDDVGCMSCQDGSYQSNGECKNCANNCLKCTDSNVCQSCAYEYYLSSNKSCASCSACGNAKLCLSQGICTAVQTYKAQTSSAEALLLTILVPIVAVIAFFVIVYTIVSRVTRKPQAETVQSKGTLPTEGEIEANKVSSKDGEMKNIQNEKGDTNRQLDPKIGIDTL